MGFGARTGDGNASAAASPKKSVPARFGDTITADASRSRLSPKHFPRQLRQLDVPVNLIGYSMGGLVIREALRQSPESKVKKVALLNSPNHGSAAAFFVPLSACREMRPGSAFLRQLNAAPWTYPTLVTWCPYDLMVFPGSSGRWDKANVLLRTDVPMHLWPVFSVEIHRSITAFLSSKDDTLARARK